MITSSWGCSMSSAVGSTSGSLKGGGPTSGSAQANSMHETVSYLCVAKPVVHHML